MERVTHSGIPGIGKVSWGDHVCHFYRTRSEMVESVVPYLVAGLKNHERCMLGAGSPFYADDVRRELTRAVPDFEKRAGKGQITIFDHHDWYTNNPSTNPVQDLLRTEERALADGYKGLRCGGNISWITRKDWTTWLEYEKNVSKAMKNRRILAICSYDVTKCEGPEVFDAMRHHHFTVAKHDGDWGLFERKRRK